jgi:hypothetical protein
VLAHPEDDGWTVATGHDLIETLVDRNGKRLQTSRGLEVPGGKIREGAGEFGYLVEACDPGEADEYAYSIQGVAVSDFLNPHFYDPVVTPGTRYSFTGALALLGKFYGEVPSLRSFRRMRSGSNFNTSIQSNHLR